MDEKDQNLPEFDLEDIIREFGGETEAAEAASDLTAAEDAPEADSEEPAAEEADATAAEEMADGAPAGEVPAEAPAVEEAEAVTSDTIRVGSIADALAKKQAVDSDITAVFRPVTEEEARAAAEAEAAAKKAQEPFSENWEPEYESPIADYIPPEPIVFRPHSRLRELKRKLIAGPERRYYELAEMGLGKLQLAILVTFLTFLFTAGATALYAMGMVQPARIRLVIFIQVLGVLIAGIMGCYRLMDGITGIFRGKFSLDSLLFFTFVACIADGILCLQQLRLPAGAAFCLEMIMALWSEYQRRNTETGQMDTMRKAIRLDAVVKTDDFYEGRPGFQTREGMVEEFMDTYAAPSGPQKVQSVYAFITLLASIGIGAAATVLHSWQLGIQFGTAALLAGVPATSFITLTRPAAVLERRMHKLGTVLCGWQGVKGLSKSATYPLHHTDLFPAGATKMNGVKFYGGRDPDQVIAYGTALISADGGGLEPIFNRLLDSRSGRHYEVEEMRSYGGGGIGGIINNEPLLMGGLSFMQDMGVDMPGGTKVNQAVYLAIDGALCAVFALTYEKIHSSVTGLGTLCSYRGLTPVMITGDFMLTESFLRSHFGVNTRRIAFPQHAERMELAAKEPDRDAPALAMYTKEGLAPRAYAITGARALRTASVLGLVIHMIGGIAGLAIMLALCLVGADILVTPANVLLYQLVWMIPGLLITEWTRAI